MEYYKSPVKRPRTTQSSADPRYRNQERHGDEQTTIHIPQILSGLQQAVSTKQRVHVLHQLLRFLGYEHSTRLFQRHVTILSKFVEGNCIHSLCLQLGYALHRHTLVSEDYEVSKSQFGNPYNEVRLILIALDAFHRQCPELVTEEYIRSNGNEVLRLSKEALVQDSFRQSTNIARPIVSLWHSFSACNFGTMLLVQNPETLRIVNTVLSTQKQKFHHNTNEAIETILECLGLLKNLSYYGEDHRHTIVSQFNLLSTMTSLADVPCDKARERLSAVIRNLALSVEVRSLLTQRADVLACLVRLSSASNKTKNTLRNVLSTITSLAIDTSACHTFVFFGDGILIQQLKQVVVHSDDATARKRAIKALRLLAKDPSSTLVILQNNEMLEILIQQCFHDHNDTVRQEATEAFCQCANLVRAPMAQHSYVLDALTKMLTIMATVSIVARTLQEQATHPDNRLAMAMHRELLTGLTTVIGSEQTALGAKESASAALVNLSEEPLAMSLSILLDAVVYTLTRPTPARNMERIVTNRIRENGVKVILNLARTPSHLQQMARHTTLLQSMLKFAAATTTSEDIKKRTKAVILKLAAEL